MQSKGGNKKYRKGDGAGTAEKWYRGSTFLPRNTTRELWSGSNSAAAAAEIVVATGYKLIVGPVKMMCSLYTHHAAANINRRQRSPGTQCCQPVILAFDVERSTTTAYVRRQEDVSSLRRWKYC